jgi:transposase-like protein
MTMTPAGKKFSRAVTAIEDHSTEADMDVKAVAREIGVSVHTVYDARRWLNTGEVRGTARRKQRRRVEVEKAPTPEGRAHKFMTRLETITATRGEVYDHPLDNFTAINKIKEAVSDCPHPQIRHALEMIGVKMARLCNTPDHLDSILDIAGYAKTIVMILDEEEDRC